MILLIEYGQYDMRGNIEHLQLVSWISRRWVNIPSNHCSHLVSHQINCILLNLVMVQDSRNSYFQTIQVQFFAALHLPRPVQA